MRKRHFKSVILGFILCIAISVVYKVPALADEAAENLTSSLQITFSGGQGKGNVTDNKIDTFTTVAGGSTIELESEKSISGFYIMWNKIPGTWSYDVDGTTHIAGEKRFLHEYIALKSPSNKIIVKIPDSGAQITDIYAFSAGTLPEWVQVWDEPCERADILLFSTHSDDEQLFFAGLLPYYSIEREAYVQVVYMTNHWDTTTRPHEQLNGLWTVGIRNYPIIAEFPDDARSLGSTSESRETVLARAQSVYNEEEWVKFQVELIRRFKPQVVVDHDLNGEYRHGAHILNADALMTALEMSNDETYDLGSVEKYGIWDVPKAYLHLYGENQIVMDYDTPYKSMNGKTPFEISKLGYACHLSQQWTWFTDWISKDKATDIDTYSPCKFGLYRTTVGEDVAKNDMLENITPWAEIIAQEEAERLAKEEEERKKAEEEAKQNEQNQSSQNSVDENQANTGKETNSGVKKWLKIVIIAVIAIVCMMLIIVIGVINANRRARRRRKRRSKRYRGEHRR